MTGAPLVSVIVPTYNRRALVEGAIRGILEQTHRDFELILVDDGSTDGSLEFIEETFDDPRIRVFRKENGGSASARNFGVAQARGRYVAYLDSDDRWLPHFLESQLACARTHPEADLVLGNARYEGGWKHEGCSVFERRSWKTPDSIDAMCNGAWALPSCMLLPAEVARKVPWEEAYPFAEDTAFLFDFNNQGLTLVENHDVVTLYCKHDGSCAEPQKIDARHTIAADHIALLESFLDRTSEANRARLLERVYERRRTLAKALVKQRRFREARPHLLAWWRRTPFRLKPAWLYLRSFFQRGAA